MYELKREVVVNDQVHFWEVYLVTSETTDKEIRHNMHEASKKYDKRFKKGEFQQVKEYSLNLCKELSIEFNYLSDYKGD